MLSLKENMELVIQHKTPEYMPMISDFDTVRLDALDFINERPVIPGVNLDWFGQSWTYEPKCGAANPTPDVHLVTDLEKWREQMIFPDIEKLDWEGRSKRDTENWQRDKKMSRLTVAFGMWERMFSVVEFQDALCALMLEPELCYDFFGAVADHKIRLHEKVIKYYKPDILCMHDDYGTSQGLFMPPDIWRKLLKPHLKRVVDHVQSLGVKYEHHNCGYFVPLMDDMVELGVEIMNPLHRSNDIAAMKKQYGDKITFIGGLEVQKIAAPGISEEEVREHVRYTMDIMCPGGGYIVFAIIKNFDVVQDEVLKYATKFYGPRPDQVI